MLLNLSCAYTNVSTGVSGCFISGSLTFSAGSCGTMVFSTGGITCLTSGIITGTIGSSTFSISGILSSVIISGLVILAIEISSISFAFSKNSSLSKSSSEINGLNSSKGFLISGAFTIFFSSVFASGIFFSNTGFSSTFISSFFSILFISSGSTSFSLGFSSFFLSGSSLIPNFSNSFLLSWRTT